MPPPPSENAYCRPMLALFSGVYGATMLSVTCRRARIDTRVLEVERAVRRVELERIRGMPLGLDLGAPDVRVADVVLARARRLLTRRRPEADRRRQLDVLCSRSRTPPRSSGRCRRTCVFTADLELSSVSGSNALSWRREERPRIVAAGLVTRRNLAVDHRRVADVVGRARRASPCCRSSRRRTARSRPVARRSWAGSRASQNQNVVHGRAGVRSGLRRRNV